MEQMNANLRSLAADRGGPTMEAAAAQIFGAGGKKLRPMIVLLVARATAHLGGLRCVDLISLPLSLRSGDRVLRKSVRGPPKLLGSSAQPRTRCARRLKLLPIPGASTRTALSLWIALCRPPWWLLPPWHPHCEVPSFALRCSGEARACVIAVAAHNGTDPGVARGAVT